ncbi:MFS transporter [Akkermansiaceae bacterium]|nr:MFS transporter [Akkermansiaceae bacterium]
MSELEQSESVNETDINPGPREWRSFWGLVGMQTMNAFNDNFAKFLLIPLGIALYEMGMAFAGIQHALAALLVLPFILFAPSAGWLGDRFAKHRVIRWSSWMQLGVLLLMASALWYGRTHGAENASIALGITMVAFFFLGSQSALLSPAKMGVVKELVGSKKLGFANGVMEGTVILAILVGQIIGSEWFDSWGIALGKTPWDAALIPILWVLIGAVISLVFAYMIQPTQPQGVEKYSAKVAFRHFADVAKLKAQKGLWRATLGIAFFWSFGGFLQLLIIQIASEKTGGTVGMGHQTALLWSPVVVGIVVGSLLVSWICRKRNEMGLIVIGGALMALSTFCLAFFSGGGGFRIACLGLAGFGGAWFLVPLNAYLQDGAEEKERGLVISASNLCINLGGAFAVALQFALSIIGMPIWVQFLLLAAACLVVTVYVARLLPKDFVRLLMMGFFKFFYRIRTQGEMNIPEKGGVLMVANHLSYIDGIVLSLACPRSIRFLMFDTCFDKKIIGKFARLFDMVPVSPTKAKDAIRVAKEALKEGDVVCIFPEGQLSRSGGLSEIKRGYEMIARKSGSPIIAAYMDGLWGSMWSFEGSKFLGKGPRRFPYEVSVAFSEPKTAAELAGPKLAEELHRLSTLTVADRAELMKATSFCEPKVLTDLPRGWSEMMAKCWADDATGKQMRANALQLNQANLASRKKRILIDWDQDAEECGVLGILWPQLIDAKVAFCEGSDDDFLSIVSRERVDFVILRTQRDGLLKKLREKGVRHLVLTETSSESLQTGLVAQGRVVSYSIPHPDYETTTMMPQAGWKEGALGKLLPGFFAEQKGEALEISGPALEESFLLEGVTFSSESFLRGK